MTERFGVAVALAPEEAQAYLAALVASSEDAIKAKTLDGTLTAWNAAAERLYGYSAAEAIGRNVGMVIPPDRHGELNNILARIRRGERIEHYETERVRKDGRRISVEISVSPVHDASGRIIGAATIARDITAQKSTQRRQRVIAELAHDLAEAHADLTEVLRTVARAAAEALEGGVLVHVPSSDADRLDVAGLHDVDPELLAVWRQMLEEYPQRPDRGLAGRVFSTSRAELIGDYTLDQVRTWAASEHLAFLERMRIGSAVMVPARARGRAVGVLGAIRHMGAPPFVAEDQAFLQDVADRVGLALDNARLYVAAQEAIRLRDEFLGVAAHELRTPVTSVQGGAQLLRRRVEAGRASAEQIVAGLAQVDSQARRLSWLVEQLLDVTRLAGGQLALEPREVDLAALVRDVVQARAQARPDERIGVDAPETLSIVGDDLRLEQVLINLLDNAVKFSTRGTSVDVEVRRVGDEALLSVRDHGPGIALEHRERVFERFFQVDRSRHYGGIGIGLHVTRQIVALHGGTIAVEAPDDGGTRMVVRLPVGGTSGGQAATGG